MKRLIIMAALAVAALGFNEASAQKVIKDASGNVYIDAQQGLPPGAFSTTTLNKITLLENAGNSVFKKLQIAKADLGNSSWAHACGIATYYDTNSANGQQLGQVNTGCKAYSAEGNAGSWRLPTMRELQLMFVMKDVFTQAGVGFAASRYWSIAEDGATDGRAISFSTSVISSTPKTGGNIKTRCVREVN